MIRRLLVSSLVLALAGCATHAPAPRGPVEIHIAALNDFHGNLEASKYTFTNVDGSTETLKAGGIDTLGAALKAWRAEDPDLLFVAAGDLVGASPAMSSMWADEPSIDAMNMLGLAASSLGNHEFDGGRKELLRQQQGGCDSPRAAKACRFAPAFGGAHYSYLAANVTDSATGRTIVPAWRIVDVKGVKVGLVGAVLQRTASVAIASSIAGLSFADEAESINQAIPAMRAQGAKVFVVLVHEGGHTDEAPQQADCGHLEGPIVGIVKKLDPAIRLVITGHSHTGYLCKVDGRTVTQADTAGHLLSRITMKVDPVTGAVEGIDARNVLMKPGAWAEDPQLSGLLAQVRERSRAELARPVAHLGASSISSKDDASGEVPVGDVIADAVLAATRAQGVQVGFMNVGGIRKDLEAGKDLTVTYGQAQAVLPFGNTLVAMDLTGAQVRTLLEQQWARAGSAEASVLQVSSGFAFRWDGTRPAGQRIVPGSVTLDGVPLDDARTYRVAANNFLAEGGDGFPEFARGTRRVDTQVRDLDALIDYLGKHPGIGAPGATLAPARRIEKVR